MWKATTSFATSCLSVCLPACMSAWKNSAPSLRGFSWNFKQHRWFRGSVLAFGIQVRGFNPGRSRRTFQGEKILSAPSFGREVKPYVPCRIFVACKKSESVCVEVAAFCPNYRPFLAQVIPSFSTRVSGGDTWRCKYERLKTRVCTISLRLQCFRGISRRDPTT